MTPTILHGDCRDTLKTIPAGTVQCCVTSPPYWGLRSYLTKGHAAKHLEIGQEKTPEAFVETMVQVFREVRRCLHDSGTLWLNIGDSYFGGGRGGNPDESAFRKQATNAGSLVEPTTIPPGCKPKDLCMIPWRVALALQADGWWLRSVICWHKKSCMPESVTDRPTNSWEPIFLLAKSQRYFYDAEAVKEPITESSEERGKYGWNGRTDDGSEGARTGSSFKRMAATGEGMATIPESGMRNQRNVWTLGPEPYSEAHFATFPTEIPRRAILAGSKCGDTVLDPFGGSGTTGAVAIELGRRAILCELNDAYLPLIHKRTDVTPGLALA
jgi:DNA modification methylase